MVVRTRIFSTGRLCSLGPWMTELVQRVAEAMRQAEAGSELEASLVASLEVKARGESPEAREFRIALAGARILRGRTTPEREEWIVAIALSEGRMIVVEKEPSGAVRVELGPKLWTKR